MEKRMREEGRGGGHRQGAGEKETPVHRGRKDGVAPGRETARCKQVQRPELKETFLVTPAGRLSCRHPLGESLPSESHELMNSASQPS